MIRKTYFEANFEDAMLQRLDRIDSGRAVAHSTTAPHQMSITGAAPVGVAAGGDADFDSAATASHCIRTSQGDVWISGNTVLCQCPECQAPMTVRMWLELADCWRCFASVQLSAEQLAAVRQLVSTPEPEVSESSLADAAPPLPISDAVDLVPGIQIDPPRQSSHDELQRLTESSIAAKIIRSGFSAIPAWLISFLLHLILILILALIVLQNTSLPPTITLSTFISPEISEGGEIRIENPNDTLVDDLLLANDLDVGPDEIRDVIQKAELEAVELREDQAPLAPLPDLDEVKENITTRRDKLMSFAARDPRVRAEIVKKEGGTSLTEAAVSRGLRWLASVQNRDGSWSLDKYDRSHRSSNRGDALGTSLALLPFLGAGQTHEVGKYKQTVAKGLAWMIKNQRENGDLRAGFHGEAGMYAHGQAAIVLCEALAMTGDEQLRDPSQRAIEFIEEAQHRQGGWRYRPGQSGDTSVLGWHLMALQSARAPQMGLDVDPDVLRLADYYLDQAVFKGRGRRREFSNMPLGSLYTYQPRQGSATPSMTAEAMLCRMYLGWRRNDPRLVAAVNWLSEEHPPSVSEKNVYYWYYATQVMHHYGGQRWENWNRKMREILVGTQEKKGSRAGSWNPKGYRWGPQGGRIYVTSLSVCTLEVYYRHLPIFNQIELD